MHTSSEKTPGSSANTDDLLLEAHGHHAELPRHFGPVSMVSFSFSIMNSWLGFVGLLLTTILMGGPTTAFWSNVAGCVASTIIAAGLAELASAFPTSGGQYQ